MKQHIALLALLAAAVLAPAQQITIRAGTLIDGKGGVTRNTTVVIEGTRIVKVDPSIRKVTYDFSGMTVLPGLIDTHAHVGAHFDRETGKLHTNNPKETPQQAMLYAAENAYITLMGGVTTLQSPGLMLDKDLRDWIATGPLPGPRILSSLGAMHGNSGTPDQIREKIRVLVSQGADLVKVFATASIREGGKQTMTDAQIQAACGEAKALGKRAIVHAQGPEGAKAAVLAGCTSIEHGNYLTDEVLDLMVSHGTYFDPNFGILLHNYIENKARYLGIGSYNEEGFDYMEKGIPIGIDTFKRALKRHVKIIFGTDAMPGTHGRNSEELVYRVKDGGQPPMDALIAATSRAAESIGLADQIGTIAPGMQADLIATDGNPADDITALRRVVMVVKGGRVLKNVNLREVDSKQ